MANDIKLRRRRELRSNMTRAESILWYHLRAKRFHGLKFRRQNSIGHYVVDYYCHQVRLVIEIDGDSHFSDAAERQDRKRQQFIESQNIQVIRFTNTEIYKNIEAVLSSIWETAKARLRLPSP